MKLSIGSDHGGYEYKEAVKEHLISLGHEVVDCGCFGTESVDYPDFGIPAAELVRDGKVDRGIVICTTGIGMSIAANKVRGVRCALCGDLKSAEMTRKHNDTNMLAMGAGIIPLSLALEITDTWLNTAFEGGERHVRRIGKITAYEAGKEQL
jgi:ribose 5-phosphate isomerase B